MVAKFKRVFMPGRFQPVHNGHIYAVQYILGLSEEIIIGVTASQFNFLVDNPFTAGERITMLKLALKDVYSKCYLVPLDNVPDNSLWLSYVESRVPKFEAVATNNRLVEVLARERGYHVINIPFMNRAVLQGKIVREKMINGEDWEKLVPPEVAEYIKEIGGDKRVKELSLTERIPLPEH